MNLKYFLGPILFFIPLSAVFTHTILYKSGKVAYGNTEIKESTVIIRMEEKTVEVSKKKILKIINQDIKDRDTLIKIMKKYLPSQKKDTEKKADGNQPVREQELEVVDLSFVLEEIRKDEIRLSSEKNEMNAVKGAVWRSVILPGWGQQHKAQPFRALGYFLPAAVSAAIYLHEKNENTKYINQYNNPIFYATLTNLIPSGSSSDIAAYLIAKKHYDALRSDVYDSKSRGESALLLLGVFWIAGIADAYFLKSGHNFEKMSAVCSHCETGAVSFTIDAGRRRLNLSDTENTFSFALTGKY